MRFEIAAMLRAQTKKQTHKMCVDITKTFFTQNVVVQNFESHGIRTLARATRRQNFSSNEKYHQQKVERPLIPDDINIKEVMEEDRAKNRGYRFYQFLKILIILKILVIKDIKTIWQLATQFTQKGISSLGIFMLQPA